MNSRSASVAVIVILCATCVVGQTKSEPAPLTPLSKPSGNPWAQAGGSTRSAKGIAIYQSAAPSVVLIVTKDRTGGVEGIGSGSLIGSTGEILTNWHVVSGHSDVLVVFKPQMEGAEPTKNDTRPGHVVKFDQVADLALVKVTDIPQGRAPIRLGEDIEITVGADVHAIGHPRGEAWTYTSGVVSQFRPGYEWPGEDGLKHKADVVQTQTPISPGSSGGPLLTDAGSLIGVNSFFYGSGQNLNFAIGIKDVKVFLARSGDRSAEPVERATAESTPRSEAGSLVSDVSLGEVRAPYLRVSPQTRAVLVVNSSSSPTPVQAVTVGALEAATANGKCPAESGTYKVVRNLKVFIGPMDSRTVTADFTANSKFFCVLRVDYCNCRILFTR